jgi:RNA polymerase sigma-70 factor (ECF subfamily)
VVDWGGIYERLAPLIHRRCLAILGDEEETLDATHDVFLLLQRHLSTFRGEAELTTWVYRVTTNHCLNRLRAARSRARAMAALERIVATAPELDTWNELARRDLARALLSGLSERRAAVLYHYFCDDLLQTEIARVMGLSERTVRNELKRGLDELRARDPDLQPQIGHSDV